MSGSDDDRAGALRRLPAAHSLALTLREGGASVEEIAERLEIEALAVHPLLVVAEAKLAVILRETSPG